MDCANVGESCGPAVFHECSIESTGVYTPENRCAKMAIQDYR